MVLAGRDVWRLGRDRWLRPRIPVHCYCGGWTGRRSSRRSWFFPSPLCFQSVKALVRPPALPKPPVRDSWQLSPLPAVPGLRVAGHCRKPPERRPSTGRGRYRISVRGTLSTYFFCPIRLPSFSSSHQLVKYRQLPPRARKSSLSQRIPTPWPARLDQKIRIAPAVLTCRWHLLKCKSRSTVLTFLLRPDFPDYVVLFRTLQTQAMRSTNFGTTASDRYITPNRPGFITIKVV